MATTTNYSWTTPDDTALVKDGAAAIRSLGTAIDTTVFNNASAAIAKTIVDAKGDIIAATAADTVSRLAVGANDTVLTADSSTATGLKWAAPAAGGGMTLISTTTLTGASITLSSIPSTYNNLQIIIRNAKSQTDGDPIRMRFNGDSGANRHKHTEMVTAAAQTFNETSVLIANNGDNSVVTFGNIYITIPDYANSSNSKMSITYATSNDATTTTSIVPVNKMGYYNQTAAISSLEFFGNSGGWTSGEILLYGVK